MKPDHDRLTRIYLKTSSMRVDRRERFLERVCQGDAVLRAEIDSLLLHGADVPHVLSTGGAARVSELLTPKRIGRYEIVERIGEGGMGVVYLAQQREPIERRVALKLVKPGFETERLLARFDSERRILARLDHPGIARVLDAGITPEGQPYFAMEHVRGEPITEFCRRRSVPLAARLELFAAACDAVHHAHQKSIVHCDLKPSNILVSLVDGRPQPKIIDFGIAKALTQRTSDPGTETEVDQPVGTPQYMSPEQTLPQSKTVDIRTDVYSLGAVLYEMLAGAPPLGPWEDCDVADLRRRIHEEQPLAPSARLHQSQTAVGHLPARKVRGDLDCIVLKALEKEPSRRYASASELAADLRRHLRHDPIEARPAGTIDRLARFARRHQATVTGAALLAPLLLVAIFGLLFQAERIARERDRAAELSEFLIRFFDAPFAISGRHTDPSPMSVLLRSIERVESDLGDRPLLQARLQHTLGETLRAVGEAENALPTLDRAVAGLTAELGMDHARTLSARSDRSQALADAGRMAEAESGLREVLTTQERLSENDSLDNLRTIGQLAFLHKRANRPALAVPLYEETLAGLRDSRGPDHFETLTTASLLASVYLDVGRLDLAGELLDEVLPRMNADLAERPMALYNRACVQAQQNARDAALDYLDRSWKAGFRYSYFDDLNLAPLFDDPQFVALARRALLTNDGVRRELDFQGRTLIDQGRYEEAESLYRFLLDDLPYAGADLDSLVPHWRLVEIAMQQERYGEAVSRMENVLEAMRETGETYSEPSALWNLAQANIGRGAAGPALAALNESKASATAFSTLAYWPDYVDADLAALAGDEEAAIRHLERAVSRGFSHSSVVRQDLALRPLLGRPDLRPIMAQLDARALHPRLAGRAAKQEASKSPL